MADVLAHRRHRPRSAPRGAPSATAHPVHRKHPSYWAVRPEFLGDSRRHGMRRFPILHRAPRQGQGVPINRVDKQYPSRAAMNTAGVVVTQLLQAWGA